MFDAIVVSDEIRFAKPQTEFFDHLMEQLDYPEKNKMLVIGDSLSSDILGGNNYGIDTCWYNRLKVKNLSEIIPTYMITQISQVLSHVR